MTSPEWSKDKVPIIGICICLLAVTWLVFGKTSAYPFINYDDPGYVSENPAVKAGLSGRSISWAFTHVHGGNWHPVTTISHMLDVQFYDLRSGWHHFTNILLHGVAAILLFSALRQMTGNIWPSAFVAAVFAVHPLRVESVVWIAERKDVLSGVFFMLTLGAYVRYARKSSAGNYLMMSIVFALGLMSKPMLVTVPLVLLLLDWWPLQRLNSGRAFRKLVIEKIPLLLLSVASCAATLIAQKQAVGSVETLPFSWRLTNAVTAIFIYIRQLFWPVDLAIFYPHPEGNLPLWEVGLASAGLLGITGCAFIIRKRNPYVMLGWLWFLVMLVPVLGIVQVGLQGHADRYTYLPEIGLCILIVWAANDLVSSARYGRIALASAGIIVVVVLARSAWIQTSYWRNSEAIWSRALAVTANNDVAQTNLSEVLLRDGRPREAISHCQEAIRLRPDNAQACNNLGLAYLRTRHLTAGIAYLKRSLELRPDGTNAALTLAWILATCPDPSVRDGGRALELAQKVRDTAGGDDPGILHTLGATYAEAGRFEEAIRAVETALPLATAQGNGVLIKELQLNLANYRLQLPLRDAGLTNSPTDQQR